MKPIFTFLIPLLLSTTLFSQNISFSDQKLKSLLITENCVDVDNDGYGDHDADTNDDGEIQTSEVEAITNLIVGNYPDTFFIKSMEDLDHFSALRKLTIIYHDSLAVFDKPNLDSLDFLWIANAPNLKHIDISNLNMLHDLRIEGIMDIEYLNLKNGNHPDGIFSLFYSENIKEACVDTFAAEYNEVFWHMAPDGILDTVCVDNTSIEKREVVDIQVFPNPFSDNLWIKTDHKIERLEIYDTAGRVYLQKTNPEKIVDLSNLIPGIYMVRIVTNKQIFTKRIMKK